MQGQTVPDLLTNFPARNSSTSTVRSPDDALREILHAAREHLGMDVAFLAEFAEGRRVFRYVDAESPRAPEEGGSDPLEITHCQRIVDGTLPELIPDVSESPDAAALPLTGQLDINAHLGVPIRLPDGRIYGTFCCYRHTADKSLNKRDLALLRLFADLATRQIELDIGAREERLKVEQRIRAALDGDHLSIVYQPIFHLAENRIIGYECLSRFSTDPVRPPDVWFREAAQVDLGVALETKAMKLALAGLSRLPEVAYLSLNASPETILAGGLTAALENAPLERIILEVTEHALIERYSDLVEIIGPLRAAGMRVAVDDAGAGYASFLHILNLAPDIIKLDTSLTQGIDTHRPRRALAAALVRFAEETGSSIVAEGVETAGELDVLRQLGITLAQGYLIGRPMPLDQAASFGAEGLGTR